MKNYNRNLYETGIYKTFALFLIAPKFDMLTQKKLFVGMK